MPPLGPIGDIGVADLTESEAFISPDEIAGLELWLDADALTGFSDGDPIGTWEDQSGNGLDATQGNSGDQPEYQTNQANGKPGVFFDAGDVDDEWLEISGWNTSLGDANFFVVMERAVYPPAEDSETNWAFQGGDFTTHYTFTDGDMYLGWGRSDRVVQALTPDKALDQVHMLEIENGSNFVVRQDGVQQASTSSGNISYENTPLIGTGDISDSSRGFRRSMQGWIYEMIVYDNIISSSDRSDLEDYLQNKWGFTF